MYRLRRCHTETISRSRPAAVAAGAALICLLSLAACVSDQYYVQLDESVHKLEQRLTAIERQQEDQLDVGEIQKQIADTSIRLDNLETELRMLSASIEEAQLGPRNLPATETRELELFYERVEARLQQLEQKVASITTPAATASSPLGTTPAMTAPASTSMKPPIEDAAATPTTTVQPSPTPAPQTTPPSARERAFYDDAYTAYKRGDYATAREKLNKFIEAFPQSQYKVNALFWIAECSYQEKRYEEAIIKYDEIITTYPHHPKASSALLKQGFAFLMIGDHTDGVLILKKVIDLYPTSDQAEIARRKLDTLR
jgi:tol-pal system protein YbgF